MENAMNTLASPSVACYVDGKECSTKDVATCPPISVYFRDIHA